MEIVEIHTPPDADVERRFIWWGWACLRQCFLVMT